MTVYIYKYFHTHKMNTENTLNTSTTTEETTNQNWADMVNDNTTTVADVATEQTATWSAAETVAADTTATATATATAATTDTVTAQPEFGKTYFARVKWFNGSKGYGFVTLLDTNTDLFIHHSEIHTTVSCWKTLQTGEYVQVVVGKDDVGKMCGRSVTGIQGGQLMCESNATQNNNRRNNHNAVSQNDNQ